MTETKLIPFPTLVGNLTFLFQLQSVYDEFGNEGAVKFLRETEKKQKLETDSLNQFLPLVNKAAT